MKEENYYIIKENLVSGTLEECIAATNGYVAVMDHAEFNEVYEKLGFGIDIDYSVFSEEAPIFVTKAEVNYDSLTGTFVIPNRAELYESDYRFHYVLDERGIVFIDNTGYVLRAIKRIRESKKWRQPSLGRFIFDFLEDITKGDLLIIERMDAELDDLEDDAIEGKTSEGMKEVTRIRRNVQELKTHYEQLHDLCQELVENENHFFSEESLRYFRNYLDRITRLETVVLSLRDHTGYVRDLYNYHQDEKQNRLMSVLTVVATIVMPLTLMTGWYGMNFVYMPELDEPYAYWVFIGISVFVILGNLIFFKKKKWL